MEGMPGDVDLRFVNQCHSEKVQIIVHSSEMVLHLEKKSVGYWSLFTKTSERLFVRRQRGEKQRSTRITNVYARERVRVSTGRSSVSRR